MVRKNRNDYDEAVTRTVDVDDHAGKESLVGTDRVGRSSNISWGAVIAGVVTFLAVTVMLSLVTAGLGLAGAGVGAGIWSIVAVALALAAGGFVAGALAVRGGLIHGFLTWATSLVVALVLAVMLGASVLGAVGGAIGQLAPVASQELDLGQVAEDTQQNVDDDEVQQTTEDAKEQASEAAEDAQPSVWWTFVGMLLGAAVAAGTGALGARSVLTRRETVRVRAER